MCLILNDVSLKRYDVTFNDRNKWGIVLFCLRQSDIIAVSNSVIEPYGFSDILFADKLAKRITLCEAQ